jgi:hypothetical protein
MFRRAGNEPGLLRERDEPRKWLGSSPAFDLHDPRLRLKGLSLTQNAPSPRDKAIALHRFVQRMPYCGGSGTSIMTARQALDAGAGDCYGKTALFVALLRVCRIPARIRFVQLRGDVMHGWLWMRPRHVNHCIAEIWLNEAWVRTDTMVYDRPYMGAAKQALTNHGWRVGYGICADGLEWWDGRRDSYATFVPDDPASMPLRDLGVYDDPISFVATGPRPGEQSAWMQHLSWKLIAKRVTRVTARMRQSQGRSSGPLAAPAGSR